MGNKRIVLREFTENDWIGVHTYASLEKVCQYQPWGPNTEEDSKEFVRQVMDDAMKEPRTRYVFAVMLKDEEKMIGAGEFNNRDFTNKVGEISYIIHPAYWGKGIGTEVATLLIDFGFRELDSHRIYATCAPRNVGSARVLEKVGMALEGRIREDLLIRDGWRDSLLFSMLEQEWTHKLVS
jgi:[ribosomal protein S5]-alanine N-acetyltransferase